MKSRPEVVRELRVLFEEGATPSRLICHLLDQHEGEHFPHALIQEYFMEAFGVPIVRGVSSIDAGSIADLDYAFLNEQLIHEMVMRRSGWGHAESEARNGTASWLDALEAHDDRDRIERILTAAIPELSESWERLSASEQRFIRRSLATAGGLYETVKILSRLAECLQRRVVELEEQAVGGVPSTPVPR